MWDKRERARPGQNVTCMCACNPVGPFMFGTSISVVDVIHAPLFVRLEAAVRVRGLDIPTTLTVRRVGAIVFV